MGPFYLPRLRYSVERFVEQSIKFAYRSNPLARWYSDLSVD